MIENLKERLNETEYVYIAFPNKQNIIEFKDAETAHIYAKLFGGIFWDHYPYEEYGFEDPYNFTNEWIVTNENGDIIEYNIAEDNTVVEVIVD